MPSPLITSLFSSIGSRNDPQVGSASLSDVAGSDVRGTRAFNQIAGRTFNDPQETLDTVDPPTTTVTEIPPVQAPRNTFQGEPGRTAESRDSIPDLTRSISESLGINNQLSRTRVSAVEPIPTTDPSFRIYIDPKCNGGDSRSGPFFEMELLPAVRQNMNHPYGTAGQNVPGAPPGVTMAHIQNVVNIGIPGSAPIQQSLGISMIQFEFVGAFIGVPRITNNMNFQGVNTVPADSCDTFFSAGFDGGQRTIPRRVGARAGEGDGAWAAAQTFSREVVARGKEVLVEINTRNDLTVQETGIITKFVPMLARNDRVWYKFTLLISDYTDQDFPHIPEDYLDPNMTLNISSLGERPGATTPEAQQRLETTAALQNVGPDGQPVSDTPTPTPSGVNPTDPRFRTPLEERIEAAEDGNVSSALADPALLEARRLEARDLTLENQEGQESLVNSLNNGPPVSRNPRVQANYERNLQRARQDLAQYSEARDNLQLNVDLVDSTINPTPEQLEVRQQSINGISSINAYEQNFVDSLNDNARSELGIGVN